MTEPNTATGRDRARVAPLLSVMESIADDVAAELARLNNGPGPDRVSPRTLRRLALFVRSLASDARADLARAEEASDETRDLLLEEIGAARGDVERAVVAAGGNAR
jgi:hypothetical protein